MAAPRFKEVAEPKHIAQADDAGLVSLAWHSRGDLRCVLFTRPLLVGS